MPPFAARPQAADHIALEHSRARAVGERAHVRDAARPQPRRPDVQLHRRPDHGQQPDGRPPRVGPHAEGHLAALLRRCRGSTCCYQNGFDCQGLWVEVGVEKELGLNSKREIEEYGLDRFARACRDRVALYAGPAHRALEAARPVDGLGAVVLHDDRPQHHLHLGLPQGLQRARLALPGHRSMPWCPRCGTSLSQHELIDSYKDLTHPSLHVRLPLAGRDREYLVVWTTTPWTLPANVAAAVRPDADYVRVETPAGHRLRRGGAARGEPDRRDGCSGRCAGPSSSGSPTPRRSTSCPPRSGFENRVVAWDDVSMEEGTGIVHIAPGCGEEDFELGKPRGPRDADPGRRGRRVHRASTAGCTATSPPRRRR